MTDSTRIEQFRQMAQADPDNELGHFSLGKALLDAGQPAEAVAPLQRAIELNPRLAKAYHLCGQAQLDAGQAAAAVETMTRGVQVADETGDRVPRLAMAKLLARCGAPVPDEPAPSASSLRAGTAADEAGIAAEPGFACCRCQTPGARLPKPPFKGPVGERIHQHVCAACWQEWVLMGTKVINELRLSLASEKDGQVYDQYMVEFLQLPPA